MAPLFRSASTTPFDRLYRQHAASVYRYARAVLGNHADAEDVTQQTFLNAYRALAQGTKPRKAENWIFTIAHNEVRRHLRDTRAQRLEVELDAELADQVQEHTEPSVTDVLRALQYLTPNQRSALVMREFEGRPYAEIAEIMGVSQGALETLMFRARRSLADALEDGLSCAEAERAVSRRLDGRLSRREARRLKKHVRECQVCNAFELTQKRQRSLLEGLSVIPVPASLLVFRSEQAAAALTGGTAVGAAAAGGSAGIAAKAAAVAAAVTVAGGVGYTTGTDHLPIVTHESRPPQHAAIAPAAKRIAPAPRTHLSRQPVTASVTRAHQPKREPKAATPARHEPAKSKPLKAAAKAEHRAAKVADRPHTPERAARPLKAKPQRTTPAPTRSAHEAKPKEAKKPPRLARPTKPEQTANAAHLPPAVPPGLENKLVDPKPPEKKP